MKKELSITFVVPVSRQQVLRANFLRSPVLREPHTHEIILQDGFSSAGRCFNEAIDRAHNEMLVFCHQDLYLPERWLEDLRLAIDQLDQTDPEWGVLGSAGRTRDNQHFGYVFSNGIGILGRPFTAPVPIQTLDEIVLVFRKSSHLRFDEHLPNFHFYGADICLQAAAEGMRSYAISAFCIHNTQQLTTLPREFYESAAYIRRKWREDLPIQTTCIRLSRTNLPVLRMMANDFYIRNLRRNLNACARCSDIDQLVNDLAPVMEAGSGSPSYSSARTR